MIEKMDSEEKGGNHNGKIELDEFLSFMGHASEVWAINITENPNDLVVDPWDPTNEMTPLQIRDADADWSFLW